MTNEILQKAYLSLGSNLGDPEQNLRAALTQLAETPGCTILQKSQIFWTEPVGFVEQDWFANMALCLSTLHTPQKLLEITQNIEKGLGRVRTTRWGPRTLDIDLLLFPGSTQHTAELTLPHPRLCTRAFVLIPLQQIAPEVRIHGKNCVQWLQELCYRRDGQRIWQQEND